MSQNFIQFWTVMKTDYVHFWFHVKCLLFSEAVTSCAPSSALSAAVFDTKIFQTARLKGTWENAKKQKNQRDGSQESLQIKL